MSDGGAGFASIVFDCDSTLASIEGIDELAAERIEEVSDLTDAAMRGEVALEEVYGRRLEIIRPTRGQVEELGRLYRERMVPDARETVTALIWLGKDVRVISGGLRPPVEKLARALGLPTTAVAAVGIEFGPDGAYASFERSSPLARSRGKPDVVRAWSLRRPALMVGDGATDAEARSEVDCFAAYMGVAYRENVASRADVVLTAVSLAPVLSLAASSTDRVRLEASEWKDLLARGDALLRNPV
ncbi:MAG: HAD-IB family phosphatase [Gemmatimonadota bacterium]